MPFCPQCGAAVEAADKFCPDCGTPQPDRGEEEVIDEDEEIPPPPPVSDVQDEASKSELPRDEGVLGFCLTFPSRKGIGPPLIGGILFLLFFLVIPVILAFGYLVHLTRAAAHGANEPPNFDDWADMLVDGVVLVLVFIPVFIVFAIVLAIFDQLHWSMGSLWTLVGVYVFPAIYTNYAASGTWRGAFDVDSITTLLGDSSYVIAWLIYIIVINIVGAFVVIVLMLASLLTIIGWIIIWPVIFFYWYAIDASLFGWAYHEVFAESIGSETGPR